MRHVAMLIVSMLPMAGPARAAIFEPAAPPVMADDPATVARNRIVLRSFYPRTSLHRGEEGDVRYRINVTRDGHFEGCQVVGSSGYEALDTATCTMLLSGATTPPLVAADGWRTRGWREGVVSWRLPDGLTRPMIRPSYTASRAEPGERLLCRRVTKVGSLYLTTKLCLTAEDWQRQYRYAREGVVAMQSPVGPSVLN